MIKTMDKVVILKMIMIVGVFSMLFGCGDRSENVSSGGQTPNADAVAVDPLFIPVGYKKILKEKELTEIAAMPYFKSPFITIAENKSHDQFAVIINETGETKVTKLPIKLEDILKVLESKGFKISVSNVYFKNLHLFEINNKLVWNYEEDKTIYLDLDGNEINPFER
jgi:hypothetical protein